MTHLDAPARQYCRPWSLLLMVATTASCSTLPLDSLPMLDRQASYEEELAQHLASIDATMYGAYWCPHSARQRRPFGPASEQLPYTECDPQGISQQSERCLAAGIWAYPTWEINGQLHEGVRSPKQLAEISGFTYSAAP